MDPEEKEDTLELGLDALENSLEKVVGANYERDNDEDDGNMGGGRMRLALLRWDKDKNQFMGGEEVS